MVYAAGRTDHTVEGASMIDHIVELVERRVAAIDAAPAPAPVLAQQVERERIGSAREELV
jgi:(E)-4-hydroxy-3-methylbut-2-enyl-diphosphate synthase